MKVQRSKEGEAMLKILGSIIDIVDEAFRLRDESIRKYGYMIFD